MMRVTGPGHGGSVVHAPRGAAVVTANRGASTLRLIVALSPAGFEARFLACDPVGAGGGPPAQEALRDRTRLLVVNDHEPALAGASGAEAALGAPLPAAA